MSRLKSTLRGVCGANSPENAVVAASTETAEECLIRTLLAKAARASIPSSITMARPPGQPLLLPLQNRREAGLRLYGQPTGSIHFGRNLGAANEGRAR